ncbi:DUF969 domain-containing protein [Psychromonas sp. L1A2]|uniref:DUF969 domain-containing protein n=1 Tax=Psychromonas sp. L1A2 TaxID=2686356 RepID=UPI00135B43BD|nr:DUF969 domain-containing protein [Psychromonas sp. L1A2]
MIDFWPLIGIAIITIGFMLRLNTLLVILIAGVVTGLIAHLQIIEILSILGSSFTQNRYMSLFILILPMIGLLEHYGLKERAEILISSMKNASVSKVTFAYLILRKVTNAMGLSLGGHPSMVRPLIAPMAEAAAVTENPSITDNQRLRVRAFAAVSENFGNFFSQLIFIGSGGLLLIKGVLNEAGYTMELDDMYVWALPSALASIIIFFIFSKIEQKKAIAVLKASEESEC